MSDEELCDLANKECVPCRGGVPPLDHEEVQQEDRLLVGGTQPAMKKQTALPGQEL